MDTSEGLPSAAKIHDVRGGKVDINPRAAIPAALHMQPQSLWRIELHLPSEWSRETKTTAHWPVQPDEELTGLVPDVALHWGRDRWRRRGRCTTPSCRRSGNGGPQTCLPAAHSVAKPAGRTTHLHQQGIQDPREGPSLARRTTQDLLWSGLARQAHEERRYQGGANLTRLS